MTDAVSGSGGVAYSRRANEGLRASKGSLGGRSKGLWSRKARSVGIWTDRKRRDKVYCESLRAILGAVARSRGWGEE